MREVKREKGKGKREKGRGKREEGGWMTDVRGRISFPDSRFPYLTSIYHRMHRGHRIIGVFYLLSSADSALSALKNHLFDSFEWG
ncbi:MAG: hypothetical protein K8T10_07750 [Candidatus Eremiobacteraeota bacterium]|nr:hypothetical protein [Candidatus Eremiobacteraeota bacterium]